MKDGFDDLDKWEDVPKRGIGNKLKNCARLSERGTLAIASDVMDSAGRPPFVTIQKMIREGFLFLRIIPSKDPCARKVGGEGRSKTESSILQVPQILNDEITPCLPLVFEVVRSNKTEIVFAAELKVRHES